MFFFIATDTKMIVIYKIVSSEQPFVATVKYVSRGKLLLNKMFSIKSSFRGAFFLTPIFKIIKHTRESTFSHTLPSCK